MTYQSEHITVNGARIHLRRAGSGAPLLFLHGAAGVTAWLPYFEELAKTRTLLVPDHPGFGESDTPAWLFGIGDIAYFYLDFIDHLGLSELDIIGHSLGGWIAAEIAARNAGALRSLTLLAPAGARVKGVLSGDVFMWSPEERANNLVHAPALAAQMLAAAAANPDQMKAQLKNSYGAARLGWQPRFFNPELQRWLHRINIPVQLIWGENDKVLPVEFAKAWTDALPKARLTKLPQCGHLPHVERTAETLAATQAFLREVAA
ncbi:MAG TPA: alpha/beta fold hydrolase [Alphaproteobacteria bacterium]